MKGHRYFIEAAARIARRIGRVHFLLCGRGVEWSNPQLAGWIDSHQLRSRFHVLGPRSDMSRIQAALDVAVSASVSGEGFSNVVGEAMACSVPCVVTDVGDSADIVGETGIVVPPWEPQALAKGLFTLLEAGPTRRNELGRAARNRIATHYAIDTITHRYATLWQDVGAPGGGETLPVPSRDVKAAA